MYRKIVTLLLLLCSITPVFAGNFLLEIVKNMDYKHNYIPDSNAPKTYISCEITEKLKLYSNEITSKNIETKLFNFYIDTNNQVFYEGKNIRDVFNFNDEEIRFMTIDLKSKPQKFYIHIINRKTGRYKSEWVEKYSDDKMYDGYGDGVCQKAVENKF